MSGQTVFISYSRQDATFVQQLIADLKTAGIAVWIDQQGLQVGTLDWQRAIRNAIRDSDALVLIVSPDSAESRYVQAELEIARMYDRRVLPVWIAGDGKYGEYVPFEFMRTQYVDARGSGYQPALLELLNVLGGVQTPAVPVPAPALLNPDFKPRNPYKGLRAFTGADTADFFGRDGLIRELVAAVGAQDTPPGQDTPARLLAVVGPSGSGKSSVVMAGLLPRLQAGAVPGSDRWIYLDPVLPGAEPLESLAVVLADELKTSISAVLEDLDRTARGLHLLGRQIVKGRDTLAVLLVDQFEELFTLTLDNDRRDHFIDLLVTAATEAEGRLFIILTLRADFYDRPMNYPALSRLLERRTKHVPPMSLNDLRDVIEKPAALPDVQLQFEPGLVGDLLFEVREQTGALPLLQFTLDQLVEQRQGQLLTRAAYDRLGGMKGALARHAESTYNRLPSEKHRDMARALFLRLIEPGETEQEATRRRAAQTELVTPDPSMTEVFRQIGGAFTDARLLTASVIGRAAMIEVSHEALIREWERLSEWLRTAREDVRLQHQISRDAADWIHKGKRGDDLYRGAKLDEARQWAGRNIASADEVAFIDAGLAAESAREQEADRYRADKLIFDAVNSILATGQVDTILRTFVEQIIPFEVSTAHLTIWNSVLTGRESGTTTMVWQPSTSTVDILEEPESPEHFPLWSLVTSGEVYAVGDVDEADLPSPVWEQLRTNGDRAFLLIPLMVDSKPFGALYFACSHRYPYRPEELDIYRNVAQRSVAIIHDRTIAENSRRELAAANDSRSEFVSFMAHELKNPMTSIRGYADLMLSGAVGQLGDKQRSFMGIIRANVDRMYSLVNDLNDLTRLQTNNLRLHIEAWDFRSLLDRTLGPWLEQTEEKGQRLIIDVPYGLPPVMGDQSRLMQVVVNLVSNAHKFTPPNGEIIITAQVQPGSGGQNMLRVGVKDNGIGMSQDDLDRLFTPYFRSENTLAREQPGTGLGLTITRGIVEQHGGQIWVESELNAGTTFYFTIPLAP